MADLEKVIKGLDAHCTLKLCDDCPYNDFNVEPFCLYRLMLDMLELLKEREAQPAIIEGSDVICIGRCPSCKTVLQPGRANYCYNCGQAVKWDD